MVKVSGDVRAITPWDAERRRQHMLPGAVILVVNELVVERLLGSQAVVKQEDILARLEEKHGLKRNEVLQKNWLDFEGLYRVAGWDVSYDRPGFNETYPATFTFTKSA